MKNKLLRQTIGAGQGGWQMWGAVIGAFLGLLLLLLSVQFFLDIRNLTGKDSSPEDRFVIINKEVKVKNTVGEKAAFSTDEIEKIRNESFVRQIGTFQSNLFEVAASSKMLGFYTELFFEALPADFIDVPEGIRFDWQEGQKDLPVILSRDYLALYNFGFAPSQGLPQFTPKSIMRVSMDIVLRGNGKREIMRGQIVGFSDRINSILVPQEFMNWANERYGDKSEEKGVSRLMLEVDNPYSGQFKDFLKINSYELSSSRLVGGQLSEMLQLISGLLAFVGLVLLLLSVLIFMLTFQLLVSRSAAHINLLKQLGYYHARISDILTRRFVSMFTGVWIAVMLVLFGFRYLQSKWFVAQGFNVSSVPSWLVLVLALVFALLFGYWNIRSIRQSVAKA